jgi:hypothetical protein
MQGFFSWEKDDRSLPVYMPKAVVTPLDQHNIGSMASKSRRDAILQDQGLNVGFRQPDIPQPQSPVSGGGSDRESNREDGTDEVVRPSQSWQPDYSSHETSNALDPLNPDNYEWNPETGQFDSKLHAPLDPANWEWDRVNQAPVYVGSDVWDAENYQGTLYDPLNPFDLTEGEWVGLTGALNSGSLFAEGRNLAEYADLAGGLSDMGGVGDEIANQAGGLMDNDLLSGLGKLASVIGIGKGIYGLTQGSGGQGGVDLATGIGANFIPAFGLIKGFFDTAMGIGQYVRDQGRQYDYYHPYINNQMMSEDGYRVMNVGFEDKIGDAAGRGMDNGSFVATYDPYNTPFQTGRGRGGGNIIEKDGQYYYIDDVADYLGVDDYSEYLAANGLARPDAMMDFAGMSGTTEMGDWYSEFQDSGLLGFNDYQNYLNDTFINSITQEGINWDSDAISRAEHGLFKDQDVMGVGAKVDPNHLVRMNEMNDLLGRTDQYLDASNYADWEAPVLPTYTRPEQEYDDELIEFLGV